jgi:NAD+ synthetase
MMPSPFTSFMSLEDARTMAATLGVRYDEIAIAHLLDAFRAALAREGGDAAVAGAEALVQVRVRATLLAALAAQTGSLVLAPGNRSDVAVGDAILECGMPGGFAVLKDVSKSLVYRLGAYRNAFGRVIPERVASRPPSPELRPGDTDQDSLPPYATLDAIIDACMDGGHSPDEVAAMGYPAADVARVVRRSCCSGSNPRRRATGVRITPRALRNALV